MDYRLLLDRRDPGSPVTGPARNGVGAAEVVPIEIRLHLEMAPRRLLWNQLVALPAIRHVTGGARNADQPRERGHHARQAGGRPAFQKLDVLEDRFSGFALAALDAFPDAVQELFLPRGVDRSGSRGGSRRSLRRGTLRGKSRGE